MCPNFWVTMSKCCLGDAAHLCLCCPLLYLVFVSTAVCGFWNELSVYKLQQKTTQDTFIALQFSFNAQQLSGFWIVTKEKSHLCGFHFNSLCVFFSNCSFCENRVNTFIGPDNEIGETTMALSLSPTLTGPILTKHESCHRHCQEL